MISLTTGAASHDAWSPYYRVNAFDADRPVSTDPRWQAPKYLSVDGIPHQALLTAAEAARSRSIARSTAGCPTGRSIGC